VAAPTGIPGRREARERAVQLVYEAEQRELAHGELLGEQVVEPDPYTTEVVAGVGDHLDEIDGHLGACLHDWTLARLAALDRAVLRVATFELLCRPDVPRGVVLSEAVELANVYGTDESSRFVNGVLAAVAARVPEA
jgi:N utilization substance protein B